MPAIYLYALSGPDGITRYIGATVNPKKRLGDHYRQPHMANHRLCDWLKSLTKVELTMTVLGEYDETTIVKAEQEEIARQRSKLGDTILNDYSPCPYVHYHSTLRP